MPQYFVGDQWTNATFLAWVAGLVDRAGHVSPAGLALWVTSRDVQALHGVRDWFNTGDIEPHPTVDRLHVWRVKHTDDRHRVLTEILPFLTSKAAAARDALHRMERRKAFALRNRKILALAEPNNLSYSAIARLAGTTDGIVANVINRNRLQHGITIRRPPGKRRGS